MSYKRQAEEKRRLRKTYDETRHSCIGGVYYDKRKKRYVRYSPTRNVRGKYYRTAATEKSGGQLMP